MAIIAILLVAVVVWFTGQQYPQPYTATDFIMDTIVTQTLYGNQAEQTTQEVAVALSAFEEKASAYREGSDLARVAAAAGSHPVVVDERVFSVVQQAVEAGKITEGLFDITLRPLTKLWNIDAGEEQFVLPAEKDIQNVLELVDYTKIALDPNQNSLYLPQKGMELDLGGIAKGEAANLARAICDENGITSGVISIGGNVVVIGRRSDGQPFRIGVRDPRGEAAETLGVLALKDRVVSTSGGYERYIEKDGEIYHHILDVRTGYPAESDLLAAVVIGKDGVACDWQSTWLFLLGEEKAKEAAQRLEIDALLITQDNRIVTVGEAASLFELTDSTYTLETVS